MQEHLIVSDSWHVRKLKKKYLYFHKEGMRKNSAKVMLNPSKTTAIGNIPLGEVEEFSSRAVIIALESAILFCG